MKNIKPIDMKHLKSFKMFENEVAAPAPATKAPAELPVDKEAVESAVKQQSPEELQAFVNELSQKLGLAPEQLKDEALVKAKLDEINKNESLEVEIEVNEGISDFFNKAKAKLGSFFGKVLGLSTTAAGLLMTAIGANSDSAINMADYTNQTLPISNLAMAGMISMVAGLALTVIANKNTPATAGAKTELTDAQKAQIARRKAKFGR